MEFKFSVVAMRLFFLQICHVTTMQNNLYVYITNLEIDGENLKKLTPASRHLEGWQRKSFPPRFLWSHILAQSKLDPPRPWHGLFRTPIHPEKSRFSLSSGNPRFSIFALRLRRSRLIISGWSRFDGHRG